MPIEEDGMEECDGCGNFMFECTCEENEMEESVVVTTCVNGEDLYFSGLTHSGVPQFVFDKRGASFLTPETAVQIVRLCNALEDLYFTQEKL